MMMCGLWPVDRLMLTYLAATGILIALFHRSVDHSGLILSAHIAGALIILAFAFRPSLPGAFVFRHWYPLPFVALCYREMSIIIASVRGISMDGALAHADLMIWRAHPAIWLERIQTAAVTEFLQMAYSLFVPSVLLVAFIFWRRSQFEDFRYYAFLITLGFLVSYVGYLFVPARGPRFFLPAFETQPLRGLWLYPYVRTALDVLESAHYDCFPSGHVEMTVLAWWTSRRISLRLGRLYAVYTVVIIFATVYLRYHYTVDLMAGLAAAAIILPIVPRLMKEPNRGPTADRSGRECSSAA
jgi:membrane-associated phospholipid phosphatase